MLVLCWNSTTVMLAYEDAHIEARINTHEWFAHSYNYSIYIPLWPIGVYSVWYTRS